MIVHMILINIYSLGWVLGHTWQCAGLLLILHSVIIFGSLRRRCRRPKLGQLCIGQTCYFQYYCSSLVYTGTIYQNIHWTHLICMVYIFIPTIWISWKLCFSDEDSYSLWRKRRSQPQLSLRVLILVFCCRKEFQNKIIGKEVLLKEATVLKKNTGFSRE